MGSCAFAQADLLFKPPLWIRWQAWATISSLYLR
jgi:hypothetical protein